MKTLVVGSENWAGHDRRGVIHRSLLTARSTITILSMLCVVGHFTQARCQDPAGARTLALKPFVIVGPTGGYMDLIGARTMGIGGTARIGVLLPTLDLSLIGEHWNEWGDYRLSTLLVETNYYPLGRSRVAPYLLIGVGAAKYRSEERDPVTGTGATASIGLGVHAGMWNDWAVRTEAVLRNDDGPFSAQLRLGAGFIPEADERRDLPAARSNLYLAWMVPLRGPWQFVNAGIGLQVSSSLNERFAATLGADLYHWQIPGEAFMRDYLWDTRAAVIRQGIEWRPGMLNDRLSIAGGPAIVAMGESPDGGMNFGLHAAVGVAPQLRHVPLTLSVGTLWFSRDAGDDQIGLLLTGGLRL